jgi:hypothetical protein
MVFVVIPLEGSNVGEIVGSGLGICVEAAEGFFVGTMVVTNVEGV